MQFNRERIIFSVSDAWEKKEKKKEKGRREKGKKGRKKKILTSIPYHIYKKT